MTPSDIDLMARVKDGDPGAFEELMRRYERPLLNYFYRQCWDRDLSEDCVQEVFTRLYRHRAGYLATAKFTTFLFTIANHLWIDRARSRARGPGEVSLHGGPDDASRGAGVEERLAAPEPGPADVVAGEEGLRRLKLAIDLLPEGQKAVLSLGHFQGLRYEDVAQILGIPVGTVKSRMHEAVRRLRESLLAPRASSEEDRRP